MVSPQCWFFSCSLSALPTAHCTNIRKIPLEWSRCKIVTSIYLHAILLRHMQKMVSKFLYLSSSKAKWQESFKWRIRLQFLIHSSSLGRSFNFELFLFATSMGIILYGHQIRERGCIWPWVNWVMPRSRQHGGSRTIRGRAALELALKLHNAKSTCLFLCLCV